MADSKVTDMVAATSVNSADVLYLVQSNTDKKLSISTLLGNLPSTITKFAAPLVAGGTTQAITNGGTITATQTTTVITNTGLASALVINNGTYEGQLKVILASTMAGSSVISSNISVSSITFSQAGHSALLIWIANKWWPIGGTAAITI